jgi:hypothetical protein
VRKHGVVVGAPRGGSARHQLKPISHVSRAEID